MEIDMMDIRVVGIICMTALAFGALIIDGNMGEMLMTAIVGGIGMMVGWMFGKKSSEEVKEDVE